MLNGQYPTGVIDWGTNNWWLSHPYAQFTGQSISFNGSGPKVESFAFIGTHTLWQIDVDNGDTVPALVKISCLGNPMVAATLAGGQVKTVVLGWTRPCTTVTIYSSNGWKTNFDNLKVK